MNSNGGQDRTDPLIPPEHKLPRKQSRRIRPLLLGGAFLIAVLFVAFLLANIIWPLPLQNNQHSSTVVARDGTPLRAFADAQGVWRFKTPLEMVSPLYIEALINYEDQYFWVHPGINPIAMTRALIQNLRNDEIISGASTLTMQVARMLDPHRRSLPGKLRQIFRALQLEWRLSKQQILELYLQLAPFGGNLQGVEAASRAYFGKAPLELSHAEAALLAVLPQAPSRYRPDRRPEKAAEARNKLVQRLVDQGVWPKKILQEIRMEAVIARTPSTPVLAPILARRLLKQYPDKSRIETSIDFDLQLAVQTQLQDYVSFLPAGTTAAAVVVENQDWLVRAYVGSALFADKKTQGYVDMVSATRSPGSTLKPFIYGLAMDESLIHSESLLVDAPRWKSQYQPENFSSRFSGAVSAGDALRKSLNVPAVQVLEKLGPALFNNRLLNAGVTPILPDNGKPNLSMALGGFGISMESLLDLFGALGREGKVARLRFSKQEALVERPLLSPQAAWIVHRMLADQSRPGQPAGGIDPAQIRPLAFKTGTSYGYRDAWSFGVSGRYTIGVWVGRPDGTPSPGQYGAITALPLLFQISDWLADEQPPTRPSGVSEQTICWPSGLRREDTVATLCHVQKQALGIDGQFPATIAATRDDEWTGAALTLQVAQDSGLRVSPGCGLARTEQKKIRWPVAVEPWLPEQWQRKNVIPKMDPRCERQAVVVNTGFAILSIKANSYIRNLDPDTQFKLPLATLGGVGQNFWYLDGQKLLPSTLGAFAEVWLKPGRHELLVINESGASDKINFNVEQW